MVLLVTLSTARGQGAPGESPAATSSAPAPGAMRILHVTPDSDVAALRKQVAEQERKIVQLEAKVGMPSTAVGWTWFLIGLVGEGVFFLRFVVQWWASERQKRTVVPMAFWHLSLAGTALVLAYAVFVINPVFILAYSLNIFLYLRNLYIAKRQKEPLATSD
jgi:lipid-A-disaccharide synthase-like uncharacterized protein